MKSIIYIITFPFRLIIGTIRFAAKTTVLLLALLFLFFLLVLFLR